MAKPFQLNSSLSDFIYTIARQLPLPRKRLLPEKYFRIIESEKSIMRFSVKSTLEEKVEFLSCIGVRNFLILADVKGEAGSDFREVFRQFDVSETQTSSLRKLGEENVFITSDRELCERMGHLSQITDDKSYSRNLELLRSTYHVKNFAKKINHPDHNENLEEKDSLIYFSKIINAVLDSNCNIKMITGVDVDSFRLLLYMAINKSRYYSQEDFTNFFSGAIHPKAIGVARKKLRTATLITKHPAKDNNSYAISGRGILVVNQFRERVIKSLDF